MQKVDPIDEKVNEDDSLKEYGSAGKRTRTPARENHQMRDILVTPTNAGGTVWFRSVHIAGGRVFRNARDRYWSPLTDRVCSLKQQQNRVTIHDQFRGIRAIAGLY